MTVADVRRKTAERMRDGQAESSSACGYCGMQANRATLSALGARCRPCFEQYQRQGFSGLHAPPQVKRSPWVSEAAKSVRHQPNQFGELADRLKAQQGQRDLLKGLDDDSVNALLQAEA